MRMRCLVVGLPFLFLWEPEPGRISAQPGRISAQVHRCLICTESDDVCAEI